MRGRTGFVLAVVATTIALSIGSPLLGLKVFHASDILIGQAPWASEAPTDFRPQNPLLGDTVDILLPLRAEFRRNLRTGNFPLWTPFPSGGVPLGAIPDVGTLSPLNLPYLVVPLWYAPGLAKLLEMVAAVGFTFLFLRRLGLSPVGSLIGGLVFVNSGFQVVWTNWPQTHVGALIPAMFWAAEWIVTGGGRRAVLSFGLVTAVMLLEGFPSVTGYALLAVSAYGLVRVLIVPHVQVGQRLARAGGLTGGVVLGFALAAVQIFPFVLRLGQLDLAYRQQSPTAHLPLRSLATLVIPNAFGTPMDRNYFGPANYVEIQSFVGTVALLLVLVALALGPPRGFAVGSWSYFLAGVGAVIVLTYVGGPLLALTQRLPLFETNFIGRLRSVLGFFLAVLAAASFERINEWRDRDQTLGVRWVGVGLVAAWGLGYLLFHLGAIAASVGQLNYLTKQLVLPAITGSIFLILLVVAFNRIGLRMLFLGAVPILIAVESLSFALPYWPRIAKEHFYPTTEAHRFLAEELGTDRLAASGLAMYPGTTTFYELRSVTSHTFHKPEWADLLLVADAGAFDLHPTFPFLTPSQEVAESPALDRLGVRYFVTSPEVAPFGVARPGFHIEETIQLSSATSLAWDLDLEPRTRGIVLQIAEDFVLTSPQRPTLLAESLNEEGLTVSRGSRALPGSLDQGQTLVLPIVEPGERVVGLRLSLLGGAAGDELHLVSDTEGRPFLGFTVAEDHLQLVFADGVLIYERTQALPRVRWAARARVVENRTERLELMTAGLEDDVVLLSEPGPMAGGGDGRVDVLEDSGDVVRLKVRAEGDGFLVIADDMQDDWRAWIGGEEVRLFGGDHAGVALPISAGTHEVMLRYVPSGWRWGMTTSGLALVIALFLTFSGVPGLAIRGRSRVLSSLRDWGRSARD